MGTLGYMSPEQVRGEAADHRSDIFAFGATLYEMLWGKRAFRGETPAETMTAILKQEPAEPPPGAVPPGLERVVRHCLEKRPEERFQSARDLAFDIEALPAIKETRAEPGLPAVPPTWKRFGLMVGVGLLLAFRLAARPPSRRRPGRLRRQAPRGAPLREPGGSRGRVLRRRDDRAASWPHCRGSR